MEQHIMQIGNTENIIKNVGDNVVVDSPKFVTKKELLNDAIGHLDEAYGCLMDFIHESYNIEKICILIQSVIEEADKLYQNFEKEEENTKVPIGVPYVFL